jgi:uncharacterized protein (TIGR02271 family)
VTTRTLTAIFDSRADAEAVRARLEQLGATGDSVQIVDQSSGGGLHGDDHKGFWESVKDFFVPDEDRYTYAEGIRRGGYLLTVRVEDDYADEAVEIIESSNAIDMDTRSREWQAEGWSGYQADRSQSERPSTSNASEQSIPVVEERLRVGKREVNRGGVRVRSYVVEQPVHEDVQLREERVEVERRPVSGRSAATSAAGDLLQERTIEATETSEEAVVAKDSVVTEEVVVKKFSGQRSKGIDETVRRTEVDVEDTRAADADELRDSPPSTRPSSSRSRSRPENRK